MGADLALVVETRAERWEATVVPALEQQPGSLHFYRLESRLIYSQCGRDSLLFGQLGVRNFDPDIPIIDHGSGMPTDASDGAKTALAELGDDYGSPVHWSARQLSSYLSSIKKKPKALVRYQQDHHWTLEALPILLNTLEELRPRGQHIRVICWCF